MHKENMAEILLPIKIFIVLNSEIKQLKNDVIIFSKNYAEFNNFKIFCLVFQPNFFYKGSIDRSIDWSIDRSMSINFIDRSISHPYFPATMPTKKSQKSKKIHSLHVCERVVKNPHTVFPLITLPVELFFNPSKKGRIIGGRGLNGGGIYFSTFFQQQQYIKLKVYFRFFCFNFNF